MSDEPPGPPDPAPVLAAARRWVDRSLRGGGGVFADRQVWGPDVLADLHRRFVGRYTIPGRSFDEKWRAQLEGAPDPTLQLAGELLYVHVLFPADLAPATKRRLVAGTLSWARDPVTVPPDLDAVLDGGVDASGIAYKARRQGQLRLLLEATMDMAGRAAADRERLLRDPWACRDWLAALPHDGAQSQRSVLLWLLHPGAFEAVVAPRTKRRIVLAFTEHVTGDLDDDDRALAEIRHALEPVHGAGFRFTDPPLAARWRPAARRGRR